MSEIDEVVTSEDTPVEEAAVPSQEESAVKETDAPSPDNLGTTDADGEPSVAQDDKQVEAYREMQARARRAEAEAQQRERELAEYRRKEREAEEAKYQDKDAWIEMMTTPEEFRKYQQGFITQQVQEALNQRDQYIQQMQEQEKGMKAADELRDFAYKEAKMSPEQYEAFLYQYSRPDPNGRMIPFYGYPPDQAVKMAKALIRDSHFPEFKKKVQEAADREADMKRKEQLKKALPGGVAPGGPSAPKTAEEAYKSAVMGATASNPNEWLKA